MKTQNHLHINTNYLKKKRYWAALLLAQFFLFFLASKFDFIIKLNSQFFDNQKAFHQYIFSKIPFSVGDIFYTLLIIYSVYIVTTLFRKEKKPQHYRQLLITLNILYFIYQIFWGLLYFQKPLLHQFSENKIENEDVKQLAIKLLNDCKTLRTQLPEDKNGVFKSDSTSILIKSILASQQHLPEKINQKSITTISSVKPSLLGQILSYTGISGYYNPFTAEAQYNSHLPDTNLGFTISHEMAHQLGYAREQEASFIGYLSCQKSNNLGLQYSSKLYALKSLLIALNNSNPDFVKLLLNQYSPKMKRDKLTEKAFSARYYGKWSVFFSWTNDLFLKSNQQDGSISYSYFTELLIKYEIEGVK